MKRKPAPKKARKVSKTTLTAVPRREGRPTLYTARLAETILELVRGGKTLKQISNIEGMPTDSCLYDWAANHSEFGPVYARARRAVLHREADDLLAIADDGTNDWIDKTTNSGNVVRVVDHEHVNRSALRVRTRQWILERLLPEQFGNKVDVSNKDGSLANAFEQAVKFANANQTRK